MPSVKRLILQFLLYSSLGATALAIAGPKIQSWNTSNGARVLFVPAPNLPILDLRIVFNAGSARDNHPGVAALTNGLLTQGAGDWNADQISERLESVGSNLETGSLRDMSWVYLRTLTKSPALEISLETVSTVLSKPRFLNPDLERVRKNTLVSLQEDEQQPDTVGSKALYQAIYGSHPYAHDPSGTKASVAAITAADLIEHFHRYYVAKNAVVAIVGALDRIQAEQIANQITAGLAVGERAPILPPVASLAKDQMERIDFPSTQSHVYVGQPGITRADPDYFPLYVGNHILGGNGLVSLLSKEVREKHGLSYNVYSYFLPMQQPGPFIMGLQTKNNQVEQALSLLTQTLRQFLQNGPTAQQLDDAKRNLTGGFPLRIDSNAKISENLAMMGFYDLPLDYMDTLNAKVDAVTIEQVRDAFKRRIMPERFVTVVVGPLKAR